MQKRLNLRALACGLAALALLGFNSANAQQINFNTWVPAMEVSYTKGIKPMFETIEKETNGKLKTRIFTAGQMLNPIETLAGVRDGAVQGGFVFEPFYPKEFPLSITIADSQASNLNPLAAIGASLETMLVACPECLQEWSKQNLVPLGGHATASYYLMCRKPITKAADLAGLRIRSATRMMAAVVNSFDGVVVTVPFTEITQAMERGSLDCLITTESWLTAFSLTEFVKSLIPVRLGALTALGFVTINKDVWNKFDSSVKQALLRNMPRQVAESTIGFIEEAAPSVEAAKAKGMKIATLDASIEQRVDAFRKAEVDRVLNDAKARGADASKLLAKYQDNYRKWERLVVGVDLDRGKFAQLLWDQVYSKYQP